MIEINLLPPEYRHVERAPFAAVVGTIIGLVIVGVLGFYWYLLTIETEDKAKLFAQKSDELRTLEIRAKEVDKLQQEKEDAEKRLGYIKVLARNKMEWGLKLAQLQNILSESKEIWVTRLNMSPFQNTSKLSIQVIIKGDQFTAHTRALSFFHNDYNFIYHFEPSRTFPSKIVPRPGMIPDKVLSTQLEFKVKPLTAQKTGK